jgi:uncharacterized membrane protein YbaN (DUF454 family)
VLPTTPFLLLAAGCFARSSERFYAALLGNRVFGPLIRDWRAHRTIPLAAKRMAIAAIVLVLGLRCSRSPPGRARGLQLRRGSGIWLWRLPTRTETQECAGRRSGGRLDRRGKPASRRPARPLLLAARRSLRHGRAKRQVLQRRIERLSTVAPKSRIRRAARRRV